MRALPIGLLCFVAAGSGAVRAQAPATSASASAPPQASAPAPAPTPAAAAPADPFRFTTDAAMMMWTVKGGQTEAFESVWGVIRSRLAASTDPALRDLGAGLRLYRIQIPASPDATYVFLANPASKTMSYSASPYLLYESGLFERPEADELFKLLQGSLVSVTAFPLNAVR